MMNNRSDATGPRVGPPLTEPYLFSDGGVLLTSCLVVQHLCDPPQFHLSAASDNERSACHVYRMELETKRVEVEEEEELLWVVMTTSRSSLVSARHVSWPELFFGRTSTDSDRVSLVIPGVYGDV